MFVERFKPTVFRWAAGLVPDRDDAEDIAQEVFVRVYQSHRSFAGSGTLEGWVYRITQRVAHRHRQKVRRRGILGASAAAQPGTEVYTTDPGGRVDRDRTMMLIHASMCALPQRQREVFDLCDLQGRNPAEAAELLGVKAVSVRASLFKARQSIRRSILAAHPRYHEASS